MSLADMTGVARAVRAATEDSGVAGVVVTVGTSTLEYVAYLTDLVVDSPLPVVFTGAMRKADEPFPDGPDNLANAVRVASSPMSRDRGVLVVFAGKILSARGCWKFTRSANDAFIDVDGPVGTVDRHGPDFARVPARTATLDADPDDSVEILKVYPGAPGHLFDSVAQRAPRGVVVEGMPGAGGVPTSMHEALARLARTDTVVVVSSRAPSGLVPDPPTGGTGSPLSGLPVLSAGPLSTEKAWVLLSVVLGSSQDPDEARSRFASMTRGARG
jgi:L-asparaginase